MRSQNVQLPPSPGLVMDTFDGILIAANLIEMKGTKDPVTEQMVEVPATDDQGDQIASKLAFRNALIGNIKALPEAVGDQRSEKGSYHNLLIDTVTLPFDHATTTDPVEQEVYRQLIELVKEYCATGTTQPAQMAVMSLPGDKVLLKSSGRKKGSKIIGSAGPVDGVWISSSHDPAGDRMDSVKTKINAYGRGFITNVAPWVNANTQDPAMAAEALSLVKDMETELILSVGKVKNELAVRAAAGAVGPAPAAPEALVEATV